jgi:hypothetical protein
MARSHNEIVSGTSLRDFVRKSMKGNKRMKTKTMLAVIVAGLLASALSMHEAQAALRTCKADNGSVWTPLDQWQGHQ